MTTNLRLTLRYRRIAHTVFMAVLDFIAAVRINVNRLWSCIRSSVSPISPRPHVTYFDMLRAGGLDPRATVR